MPTVYPVIPEVDPPYFGGDGGNGAHPSNTAFANLERPRELPPLVTTSCKSKRVSREVKAGFDSLCSGHDLSIEWTLKKGKLSLSAHYKGDKFEIPDPLLTQVYIDLALVTSRQIELPIRTTVGFSSIDAVYSCSEVWWKPLKDAVNKQDREALGHRLLHHFLRTQGSSLDLKMAKTFCTNLDRYYTPWTKTKKWKYVLDLSLIRADILFALEAADSHLVLSLCHVGEGLEALGRFIEAANVYQFAADTYADTLEERIKQQHYSSLAWRRGGEYESSERTLVKALFIASERKLFDFMNDEIRATLSHSIVLYLTWDSEDMRPGEEREVRLVGALFVALLYRAGFQPLNDGAGEQLLSKFGRKAVCYLSPQFMSREQAKKAIVTCCGASSVPAFRCCILTCRQTQGSVTRSANFYFEVKGEKQQKKSARRTARTNLFVPRFCSNIGCEEYERDAPFKKCPCKEAYYCSKDCQVAHWMTHKHVCADRAKRKKNKK